MADSADCEHDNKRAITSFDRFRFQPDLISDRFVVSSESPLLPPAPSSPLRRKKSANEHTPRVPAQLIEKFRTIDQLELPLRLILVGHNPSDHAWASGHYYSNPVNRLWSLLRSTDIVPRHFTAESDDICPSTCGIGFTDVGHGNPGTNSNAFTTNDFIRWRASFYSRLSDHIRRAATEANCSIQDAAPRIIAFTGKRQWQELFFDRKKLAGTVEFGVQTIRPIGWPKEAKTSVVFVLTSPSGAAALTNDQREAPYRELSALLQAYPWPDPRPSTNVTQSVAECKETAETIEIP